MKQFRGITNRQETRANDTVRDVRPFYLRLRDTLLNPMGAMVIISMVCLLIFIFPFLVNFLVLIILFVFWYSMWSPHRLPYKMPIYAKGLDYNDPKPGSNAPGKPGGIYYFGNEFDSQDEIWFNNGDMRTHCLIFGSTGSGKTEALLSISYNALAQGSGFIYVDGKGDNSLFSKVFSMARAMGREDDLLVVNFMTGARDVIGPQDSVLSNTMNPFATGSSSMLSQLVTSMMDSSSQSADGDMWKGRAISFTEALMRVLVYLRDRGDLLLDAGVIRRYFTIEAIEGVMFDQTLIDHLGNEVKFDRPLPFEVKDPLGNYLSTLPGFRKDKKGSQSDKVYEQHGYIVMQLTRIFGSLADVYGHIIKTSLAEVDFHDVVLNRRILVVLLPALEKSPDELSNLGKLIIASLKAMLAAGLGDKVEGDYKDVIETKPTNSNTPYLCVLDEYGYYAVPGFAVVPAQARSLGFSVVFAGQDLPAFQKASKEEAASICANTNIKICMKLEDPQETYEFFQKTAGESYVSVARGFNVNQSNSISLNYEDSLEASLEKRARIDLLDLKDQREGEAHVFFKSTITRVKMFYANPPKVEKLKVNQFLKVETLSEAQVKRIRSIFALKDVDLEQAQAKIDQMKMADQTLTNLFQQMGQEQELTLEQVYHLVAQSEIQEEPQDEVEDENPHETDIFLEIALEDRVKSIYYDFEISSLEDSLVDYDSLKVAVEKFAILNDMSRREVKGLSTSIANTLAQETDYQVKVDPSRTIDLSLLD